ncbi:MAG: tRNA(Ile)-lysidine synthase [Parvicellaceae bacterium]|jgi:tRNA(Ile)-lysidine synthase
MHQVVDQIKMSLAQVVPDFDSKRFLIAVSGGIDSMTLLNACIKLRLNVEVAHCNFQLRGYESDEDEKFIEEFCAHHDIKLHLVKFDTENEKVSGESTQMVARRLRYDWFDQITQNEKLDGLLLAHHLDDQIESFFINFLRGTGVKGLIGILPLNGNRIRPMLNLTKNDIEQYANYLEMEYREDSSNTDFKYVRNKIRHHIMPLLKEIRPEIYDIFQNNSRKLSIAQEALDVGYELCLAEFNVEKIELVWFKKLPIYYQYRLLQGFGFNQSQCDDLVVSKSGSSLQSGNYKILVDRESFQIVEHDNPAYLEYSITKIGDFSVPGLKINFEEKEGSHIERLIETKVSLSKDEIRFPLKLRSWKEGDSFIPLGMHGSKKLSDFFIDEKMNQQEKTIQWVLENKDGRIVWVVGRRISEEFKVKTGTHSTLVIETFET